AAARGVSRAARGGVPSGAEAGRRTATEGAIEERELRSVRSYEPGPPERRDQIGTPVRKTRTPRLRKLKRAKGFRQSERQGIGRRPPEPHQSTQGTRPSVTLP